MYRKLIALATCLAVAALCWPIAANAREEEQGNGARSKFSVKPVEGTQHAVVAEVILEIDAEAVALEFVGNVPGVVERFLQRGVRVGVFGVSNHERISITCCEGWGHRNDRKGQGQEQCKANFHQSGVQQKMRRLQLVPPI